MLPVENEILVAVDFADGIFAEVQFLKIFKITQNGNAVKIFDVVLVENQLAKILVWCEFSEFCVF